MEGIANNKWKWCLEYYELIPENKSSSTYHFWDRYNFPDAFVSSFYPADLLLAIIFLFL